VSGLGAESAQFHIWFLYLGWTVCTSSSAMHSLFIASTAADGKQIPVGLK